MCRVVLFCEYAVSYEQGRLNKPRQLTFSLYHTNTSTSIGSKWHKLMSFVAFLASNSSLIGLKAVSLTWHSKLWKYINMLHYAIVLVCILKQCAVWGIYWCRRDSKIEFLKCCITCIYYVTNQYNGSHMSASTFAFWYASSCISLWLKLD